jgi:predicted nuclease of predicted toxin-antitoxin system
MAVSTAEAYSCWSGKVKECNRGKLSVGDEMGTLFSELGPLRAAHATGPLVYADANVPAPLVGFMRERLHWDVLHVIDEPSWRRATDLAHFHRARDLHRTIVTLDHDFLEDRRFPPVDSPGVIVLNGPDDRALRKLLSEVDTYLRRCPAVTPLAGRKLCLHPGWTSS